MNRYLQLSWAWCNKPHVIILCVASFWIGVTDTMIAAPPRNVIPAQDITQVSVLPQNWSEDEARWFYNVPQGSKWINYDWFLHLEQADSDKPFRDAEVIRSLGFIPRSADDQGNPDGLPVGFVKDGNHIGLTCAACHTGLIQYQGKAWLIDGAPTLGDTETLQRRLADALSQTLQDTTKFDRFAMAILGNAAPQPAKDALKLEMRDTLIFRQSYNARNLPQSGTPRFGPGRVDAFGAIINEVTSTFAQLPGNFAPANAPVSYPFLWDTPQHDQVQWNGAAKNFDLPLVKPLLGTSHVGALGRNVGEVLGVFGKVETSAEGDLLHLHGYKSSVNKKNLIDIEESLRKLWSPLLPPELTTVNGTLRTGGEQLFEQHCRSCHATIKRDDVDRSVFAAMKTVGTDQTMASNFATRIAKSGVFNGRRYIIPGVRRLGPEETAQDLLVHMVQRVVLWPSPEATLTSISLDDLLTRVQVVPEYSVFAEVRVGDRKLIGSFSDVQIAAGKVQQITSHEALRISLPTGLFRQELSALNEANRFVAANGAEVLIDEWSAISPTFSRAGTQVTFNQPATIEYAYKGRPLNGIWATAPYLHNGSVPNLDELLKPSGKRITKFRVGSREFDPINIGFRVDQGDFELDTSLPGNSNAGHDYGREFTQDERLQLIEYMKSL